MKIIEPETKEDFERYFHLRWRLLRMPHGQPEGSEKDSEEESAFHIMACGKGRVPVGIGRLHFNSQEEAQIRYMAVEEGQQKKGTGKMILERLERKARESGARLIILHSREGAVGFYEKMGYRLLEPSHVLFGQIRHFKMQKDL